jgi:DNA-binding PadR family transcriptional regulator
MGLEVKKMDEEQGKIHLELNSDQFQKIQKLLELSEDEEEKKEEQKAKEKNANFVQLYKDHMPEIRWLMAKHSFASTILFFILEHMDNKNALACSYSIFEDYFEKSRMTIYRAIKTLQDNGFIDVLKMGTSNVYIVNEDLAWTDKNTKKKFAKYDGKILVSKKENKDYEYRNRFDRFKALRDREGLK